MSISGAIGSFSAYLGTASSKGLGAFYRPEPSFEHSQGRTEAS